MKKEVVFAEEVATASVEPQESQISGQDKKEEGAGNTGTAKRKSKKKKEKADKEEV